VNNEKKASVKTEKSPNGGGGGWAMLVLVLGVVQSDLWYVLVK